MTILLVIAAAFLAFSNGANDNFKGVASLSGSRTVGYRTALSWATATTFAGSICSIFLAQTLLVRFSGRGLVPDSLAGSEPFILAVGVGAAVTVFLAARLGFPISTTHALTGGIVGVGLAAVGGKVAFGVLARQFLLPLILGPVIAVALGALIYLAFRFARLRLGITKETCICLGTEQRVIPLPQPATVLPARSNPTLSVAIDSGEHCVERYAGSFLGIHCQRAMDSAHVLSAGVVSFARGLNDTPKIAALLLIAPILDIRWSLVLIATAMAFGGLMCGRRVAETMSHRITAMNHSQGFAANIATGTLVILASTLGLPLSTTHVSVGALAGIGAITRQANPRALSGIALAWLLTLPCAAALSATAYWLLARR
ncbi:MAG: inorganic phosphate transporter [Chthoniobacteraceae bacterium]